MLRGESIYVSKLYGYLFIEGLTEAVKYEKELLEIDDQAPNVIMI